MGAAMVEGLTISGWPVERIHVGDPDGGKRLQMESRFGVRAYAANRDAVRDADLIILACKPALAIPICQEFAPVLSLSTIVVSCCAGVPSAVLRRTLGLERPLIRIMPNTAVAMGQGAIGLYADEDIEPNAIASVSSIFDRLGIVCRVDDETLLDAVIALSGSGPAYFFLLMEAMIDSAVSLGMNPDNARRMAVQTALGAARLAARSACSPAELRKQVATPGGTTEQALNMLERHGFRKAVAEAMFSAKKRAALIAEQIETESKV